MIEHIADNSRFSDAYSLIVARHGTLLAERYFNGRREEQRSDLRSVTKSVTSLGIGIAVERGQIPDPGTKLSQLLPAYVAHLSAPLRRDITLLDVLTMQAGLEWDDSLSPWWPAVNNAEDLVEYVLSQEMVAQPGSQFRYSMGLT